MFICWVSSQIRLSLGYLKPRNTFNFQVFLINYCFTIICLQNEKIISCALSYFTIIYSCVEKSWETSLIMDTRRNTYIRWTESLCNKNILRLKNNKIFIMQKIFSMSDMFISFFKRKF